jgi:hypothetical protein
LGIPNVILAHRESGVVSLVSPTGHRWIGTENLRRMHRSTHGVASTPIRTGSSIAPTSARTFPAWPEGCLADSDGDGVLGADDRCPDRPETPNGFEDKDGCPDKLSAAVKSFMGVIAGIEFETNQRFEAVSVLTEYPCLRVEITGHTDDRGPHEHNLGLSLERAESVKRFRPWRSACGRSKGW